MEFRDPFASGQPFNRAQAGAQPVAFDAGLRAYMLRIYNYMASALALTGIVALIVANSPAALSVLYNVQDGRVVSPSGVWIVTFFALIGVSFYVNLGIQRMSVARAQGLFWAYAGLFGVMLSSIFLEYTGASIARTFFVTAIMFGSMSIYGYTTKRDLTSMGHFLMMGMYGVFIAMIVNMFMHSSAMDFVISIVGVAIFTGLTAYNTQSLKTLYYQVGSSAEALAKVSILGALSLYADFMNIFLFLLRFMGDRR